MNIRPATENDAKEILTIIDEARNEFKRLGIPQWNNGYPSIETILEDINNHISYVIENDGSINEKNTIIATAVLTPYIDPNYEIMVEGKWLSPTDKYVTIHRLATSIKYRGHNIAYLFFLEALKLAKKQVADSIRIDTHDTNKSMLKWIEKCGFVNCGIVSMKDGSLRNAYEFIITQNNN